MVIYDQSILKLQADYDAEGFMIDPGQDWH